jgi:catechol 2,3-dioxygenase-like lactoylglutathione lyase family enzyme
MDMLLQKLHHVAYRCTDVAETVDFYTKYLGLELVHALTNERLPSSGVYAPHIHIFFAMADGSFIAFFEVPLADVAQEDRTGAAWAQHLALEVADMPTMMAAVQRLRDGGIPVVGPIDHHFCQSVYFPDPSGHRLEMTVRSENVDEMAQYHREAAGIVAGWKDRAAKEGWSRGKTSVAS